MTAPDCVQMLIDGKEETISIGRQTQALQQLTADSRCLTARTLPLPPSSRRLPRSSQLTLFSSSSSVVAEAGRAGAVSAFFQPRSRGVQQQRLLQQTAPSFKRKAAARDGRAGGAGGPRRRPASAALAHAASGPSSGSESHFAACPACAEVSGTAQPGPASRRVRLGLSCAALCLPCCPRSPSPGPWSTSIWTWSASNARSAVSAAEQRRPQRQRRRRRQRRQQSRSPLSLLLSLRSTSSRRGSASVWRQRCLQRLQLLPLSRPCSQRARCTASCLCCPPLPSPRPSCSAVTELHLLPGSSLSRRGRRRRRRAQRVRPPRLRPPVLPLSILSSPQAR